MTEKILLIDGDAATISWLKNRFESEGFAVDSVNRGNLAWQKIEAALPDLIVLDLSLPDMDGLELIQRIRQRTEWAHLGIIVLSQRVLPEEISASLNAGANEYLVKRPGADIELIAKVRVHFSQPHKTPAPLPPSRGRIFAFCSAKGGAGTTSVCINTAYALAKTATPTTEILLVDLVLPMGTVAQSLGFDTHKTVSRLTHEANGRFDEEMIRKYVSHTLRWGFRVLIGSNDPLEAADLDGNQILPLFQTLKSMYDYILVDFGRNLSRISLPIIQMSTGIVVIATPDISTVRATRLIVEHLEAQGVERDRMMLINNRTVGRVWTTTDDIVREIKLPLAATIPYEVEYMTMAMNAAVPFMEKFPENSACMSFIDIAHKVIERANPKSK